MFEKSCQTAVKYILGTEIFQKLQLKKTKGKFQSFLKILCIILDRFKRVLFGGDFYLGLLKILLQNFFF